MLGFFERLCAGIGYGIGLGIGLSIWAVIKKLLRVVFLGGGALLVSDHYYGTDGGLSAYLQYFLQSSGLMGLFGH